MPSGIHILFAITYLVIGILLILGAFFMMKNQRKKKIKSMINNLERDKNLIISATIISELNKVESLINNQELKETFKEWQSRFNTIRDEEVPKITDMLLEIDGHFNEHDYKTLLPLIVDCELDILYAKTRANYLLSEIQEITLSESKNREIITKLKIEYRKILTKYHNNVREYEMISGPIELQMDNIDKLFSAFEVSIENNAYSEVSKIVKAIDDVIGNLKMVIDEAPNIILIGKNIIPTKLKDIDDVAKRMINDGYNLDYLNLDYNKEEINKKISDIFSRLNVLNIEDSTFELKTMLDYIESLYADFDKEKLARSRFDDYQRNTMVKIVNLENVNNNLVKKIDEIKYSYDLTNEDVSVIYEIRDELSKLKNDYEILIEAYRNHQFAFSKLLKEMDIVCSRLTKTEDKLNSTLKSLASLKDDENRARDQLVEIREILLKSKDRVNTYKLPIIPKEYFVELKEASVAIREMNKELNKMPLSIKVLNTRVDTARDLTLKLYNTSKELVKTARMAEMAIVYGNRYRPLNRDIDMGLYKAESLFYKGNYQAALKEAINAINVVEPGIYQKLLDEY